MTQMEQQPLVLEAVVLDTKEVERSHFYRPELDLLRFTAFFMVFLGHGLGRFPTLISLKNAGAFGLQVFFFLSSFLISELLLQEDERTSTVHLGAFFTRRVLRIWPLYFFALTWVLL